MKRILALTLLFPLCSAFGEDAPDAATPASEVQSLFDGETLNGWEGNEEHWRVEDGAIVGEIPDGERLQKNEFLYWEGEAGDFELTLEFRLTGGPAANSGIQYRSERLADGHAKGYQADLDNGAVWLGRIYDEHGRALLLERGTRVSIGPDGKKWVDPDKIGEPEDYRDLAPAGEWNTYQITAKASHVEVRVNGKLCAVLDDTQEGEADYSGRIAFQLHSGPGPAMIEFRNIRLKKLGESKPAEPLERDPSKSTSQRQRRREGGFEIERAFESPALWHLGKNPAPPAESESADANLVVSKMLVPEGFQIDLIAAEPDIHQPIAFTIDEKGRLWVVEAHSYPNRQPEGEGKDRVVILEDKDGDGTFESQTTFIEGLNLVSGIEVGFGGVWIGAAPELLFIPDANQDDVPDGEPVVLLDGFGYQDTHETMNNFVWGPDGWLYGNQGVFNKALIGKPGASDEERTLLRAGVWRYHPIRHEFEIFAHGGSNQWGLDFNSVGHLFMTHCRSYWGGGGTTYVIRNGHYWTQTNSNYAPYISNRAPEDMPHLRSFLPASAKYDSGEGGAGKPGTGAVYGGHSHVGTMVYLGDQWPEIYRDHLFTHNLHGHQLNHQHNVREGSGYETLHGGFDMLYVPDGMYVAVDLKYGPDGSVYMTDWVDTQHCHSPHDEKWDRTNGRIYRMSYSDAYQPVQVDLAAMSDLELAELHAHSNEWYVRTARRLLQHRAAEGEIDAEAVDCLNTQLAEGTDCVSVLRALWTLHGMNALTAGQIEQALSHSDDRVRSWAVLLAFDNPAESQLSIDDLAKLATNPSHTVRLAVASVVREQSGDGRWDVVERLANQPHEASDRFLPKMVWYALGELAPSDWERAFAIADNATNPQLADWLVLYASQSSEGRDLLAHRLAERPAEQAGHELQLMSFSLESEARVDAPVGWEKVMARFGGESEGDPADASLVTAVEQMAAVFGDEEVLARKRALLADDSAPLGQRQDALRLLRRVGDADAVPIYVALLDRPAFRSTVIPLLSRSNDPAVAEKLINSYASLSQEDQQAVLGTLTSRPPLAVALLKAVENEKFDKHQLTAFHIRQMRDLQDAKVNELADSLYGKPAESSAEAKAQIERLKKAFSEAPLWAFETNGGRRVFEKSCASCHPLSGEAGKLGPDITAAWRNGAGYYIENIIDPNAVVGEQFQLTVVARTDGTIVSGIVENESDSAITMRTAEATVTVPKSDIDAMKTTPQSFMPTGILDTLTDVEQIELLKFLTTPK